MLEPRSFIAPNNKNRLKMATNIGIQTELEWILLLHRIENDNKFIKIMWNVCHGISSLSNRKIVLLIKIGSFVINIVDFILDEVES